MTTLITGDATQPATAETVVDTAAEAPATGKQTTAAEDPAKTDAATEVADKAEEAPAKVVPEQYADFTAPEGLTIDPTVAGDLKALAKEAGLSQEEAQKVADLGFKLSETWQAKLNETHTANVAQWVEDTRNDKDLGGPKLDENLAEAKRVLKQFGSPALTAMLNDTGLGNHPEVVRVFRSIAKVVSEDVLVPASNVPGTIQSAASKLYPSMTQG